MNNNNTGLLYKRAFAYFLDLLIICVVVSLLTYYLPSTQKYMNNILDQAQLETKIQDLQKQKDLSDSILTKEEIDESTSILIEQYNDLSYESYVNSVETGFITCTLSFLYFGVIAYFTNGQTLGKKAMKIKVVSNDEKPLKVTNFMIRAFIIDRVYMDIIINTLILVLSKDAFMKSYNTISNILTLFWVSSIFVAAFRLDNRGLHDLVGNTKVISTKVKVVETPVEEKPKEVKKIKCPYCNSKVDDNFDICPKCGNNIKQFEKDNKKIKEAVVKTKKKSVKKENK